MQPPMELVPEADAASEAPATVFVSDPIASAVATSEVDERGAEPLQALPHALEAEAPTPDDTVEADVEMDAVVLEATPDPNVSTPRFTQSATAAEMVGDANPSFLKTVVPGRHAPRWRRWLYVTVVFVLAIGLVVQVGLQQRARIVATEPALAPVLQWLCQWTGCVIGPLRQIESVVIESSSFMKVKADVYRLSFSIKNTALVPVALPFAEVTLTDLRDQSVLRRVVAPADYGARATSLAPGEELSLVVPVAVKAAAGVGEKITGYRLLVFYP